MTKLVYVVFAQAAVLLILYWLQREFILTARQSLIDTGVLIGFSVVHWIYRPGDTVPFKLTATLVSLVLNQLTMIFVVFVIIGDTP